MCVVLTLFFLCTVAVGRKGKAFFSFFPGLLLRLLFLLFTAQCLLFSDWPSLHIRFLRVVQLVGYNVVGEEAVPFAIFDFESGKGLFGS